MVARPAAMSSLGTQTELQTSDGYFHELCCGCGAGVLLLLTRSRAGLRSRWTRVRTD
jgi:hypothetical protein